MLIVKSRLLRPACIALHGGSHASGERAARTGSRHSRTTLQRYTSICHHHGQLALLTNRGPSLKGTNILAHDQSHRSPFIWRPSLLVASQKTKLIELMFLFFPQTLSWWSSSQSTWGNAAPGRSGEEAGSEWPGLQSSSPLASLRMASTAPSVSHFLSVPSSPRNQNT